ncbi:hypothetical protein SAMN05444695_12314 [Rhodococcus triatomae]|uniref:Uncharacterized protein n=1 Tax=Rhodococcus triatomae TaxID=300028 RepID=A0A1G8SPN5_9NOCA|nr:hypothetical protein [Rhodococcus triatomae]SDJ31219.1 hypothetical protein SAMN05444695_12314 [Rhodococcus triatomae]
MRFDSTQAAKGWETLCRQAPANTLAAYNEMRARQPKQAPTPRHHRLKGALASAVRHGVELEQWQFEVTGSGRVWYLLDVEGRTLWLRYAGTGHPKATD